MIDLDTVMPGYFISDVGDMMRTYLSPVSEEESDFTKIRVRKEIYKAIEDGYLSEMGAELTFSGENYFHFAGIFMIYMQALRFLTDHINNDSYYGARYEGHNFVRAGNQITLLQRLMEFVRLSSIFSPMGCSSNKYLTPAGQTSFVQTAFDKTVVLICLPFCFYAPAP